MISKSLIIGLFIGILSALVHARQSGSLAIVCQIEPETTANNQSTIEYYTCGTNVSFMVVKDSTPDLRLKQLRNKTVELRVEVMEGF